MVVFDIVWNGIVQETLRPSNQNRREMYWFLIDRIPVLKQKYGSRFKVYRRWTQE